MSSKAICFAASGKTFFSVMAECDSIVCVCVCVCVCIRTTSFLSTDKWINFYINKMYFYIINSYLFLSVDGHLVCSIPWQL